MRKIIPPAQPVRQPVNSAGPIGQDPGSATPALLPRPAGFEGNLRVVASGGGATFTGKLFLNVVRFFTAIWLARLLGAHQLGLYSLALSTLNVLVGLSLFGMDAAMVRFIAIMAIRKDEEGVWQTIQIGFGVTLLLSALFGTLLYALAAQVANNIFHEPQLTPLIQLATVFIPLLVMNDMLGNALKGFKKFSLSSLAMFVYQPLTRVLLIGLFALMGLTPAKAVVSFGLASVTASAAMFYYLNRHFHLNRPLGIHRQRFNDIIGFSFPVWLSGLMSKFQGNIQTMFLGSMSTIAGVGIFSVANQITIISGEFSSSINTSARPVIAELYDRRDLAQMSRIYQNTNKWVVMVQLPIFLLIVLLPQAILSIFGESYTSGASALILLAVADLLNTATGMGGVIIDMAGYTRLKLINSIIRLVLYIGLDILLIPRWGLLGAASAVMVGEGVVNLLRMLQVYVILHMIPYNRTFGKPLLAILAALAGALLMRAWLPAGTNLLYAAAHAAVLTLIYISTIVLLGFSHEELALAKSLASPFLKRRG